MEVVEVLISFLRKRWVIELIIPSIVCPLIWFYFNQHETRVNCLNQIQDAAYRVQYYAHQLNAMAKLEDQTIMQLYPKKYSNTLSVERVPPTPKVRAFLGETFYQRQKAYSKVYIQEQLLLHKNLNIARIYFKGIEPKINEYMMLTFKHQRDPFIPSELLNHKIQEIVFIINSQLLFYSFQTNWLLGFIILLGLLFIGFRLFQLSFNYSRNLSKTRLIQE